MNQVICVNQIIEFFSGILTPVTAVAVVYIAWQQLKANRLSVRLKLYDRQACIYGELKKVLDKVFTYATVSKDDMYKFRTSSADACFLFDNDIVEYLDEIYHRGMNLAIQHERSVNEQDADKINEEYLWLCKQYEPAERRFKKYLKPKE